MKYARSCRIPNLADLLSYLMASALVASTGASATVLRVHQAATGAPADGSSWANAYRGVPDALSAAQAGDEVWVAAGSYDCRATLPDGVALYGGFRGDETDRGQRNWRTNVTVLDGGSNGSVLTVAPGAGPETVVDGFRIQNGNGRFSSAYRGGGVYCAAASPTIRHNVFFRNRTLYTTLNAPLGYGGGIFCAQGATPRITDNAFYECTASYGGAIYCSASSPIIANNTILRCIAYTSNGAQDDNGAIYVTGESSAPVVVNNIMANAPGLRNDAAHPGNPDIRNNCTGVTYAFAYLGVPDPIGSNGNISADPKVIEHHLDFRIMPDSPCVDAGDDKVVQAGDSDLEGQDRIQGARVDIGADESDGETPAVAPWVLHVTPAGKDTNSGLSWDTALKTVVAAAKLGFQGDEIWMAAGTYTETATVNLNNGESLLGGFAGTETARDQRDIAKNRTILWGSITGSPYVPNVVDGLVIKGHVTVGAVGSVVSNNIISGFGVQQGLYKGGGLLSAGQKVLICDNVIEGWSAEMGGGAYVSGAGSIVQRNVFRGNSAGTPGGGGLYTESGGSVEVRDNLFVGNTSTGQGGALSAGFFAVVVNNTFIGNTTGDVGQPPAPGATVYLNPQVTFGNNIVAFNTGGVYGPATLVPRNNCVFANGAANYSGLADPTGTNGNISADPLFVDRSSANYHLQEGSPCVDAGDDAAVKVGETDLDGQPRIVGPHVDMGAYELAPSAPFTLADARTALAVAAGLQTLEAETFARLNVRTDAPAAELLDVRDALVIARNAAGLEP